MWGKREIIYLSLHCHHQNYFCIKMGSDESHFNVSLVVRDKVTRQCPQTTTFEENREPRLIRTEVPLITARPNRLIERSVKISDTVCIKRNVKISGKKRKQSSKTYNRKYQLQELGV